MFLFWFLYIYHHRLVKHLIQYLISLQPCPNGFIFFNSFSPSMAKQIYWLFVSLSSSLTLKHNLGYTKTNGFIGLSKYPINYLEFIFVLTSFEIFIWLQLTFQILIGLFCTIKFFFCYFCLAKSQHYHTFKKVLLLVFS